jgi:hypothetical protein
MASKAQMTGMQGVYLVAAELSYRGLIVSPTSRSAAGADLLVTDLDCRSAWSVQVKTNSKKAAFWLVGTNTQTTVSKSHVYVFVNLKGNQRPEYLVVASAEVASKVKISVRANSTWYAFHAKAYGREGEGWEIFHPVISN